MHLRGPFGYVSEIAQYPQELLVSQAVRSLRT